MKYDLFWPYVTDEMRTAVNNVLHTRFIGQGPEVDRFERKFETFFKLGPKNAVSVNSGSSALETAYDILGLKEGDEVISTPMTCSATNIPLARRGCKIVWADVNPDTLCIDPQDVLRKVTSKTRAVVQVHLGGIAAPIEHIDHATPLPIISDAAQALGVFKGDFTCCSFQSIKHISTGDGGMVCFHSRERNNERDRNNAKLLRWFGIDREKKIRNNWQAFRERAMCFDIQLPGHKRHMNDIAAAMGIAALDSYEHIMNIRAAQFNTYRLRLEGMDGIRLLDGPENRYWLATVLVDRRDDFARAMFEADIDTNLVQIRNDLFKIFGGKRAPLPNLASIEERYICIPIGPHLKTEDIHFICDTIEKGW